jgi:ketosteroid isomerase-like protein
VLVLACSSLPPVVDNSATESAIRQATVDWVAAEASNNVDSALSYLWEDATMQPPNAPEIQGHAAIRAAYGSVTFVSLTVGPTKVRASADLAAIWGPLTVTIQGPSGPITLDQKFVAVWQRRDGEWKVIENSWNDNAPPQADR